MGPSEPRSPWRAPYLAGSAAVLHEGIGQPVVWSLLCPCSQPQEALYKCGEIAHGLMGLGPHCAWCVAKAHLLPPSAHWVNNVPRDSDAQLELRSSGFWYPPGSQQGFPTWVGNLRHCDCHCTREQRGTSDATLGT